MKIYGTYIVHWRMYLISHFDSSRLNCWNDIFFLILLTHLIRSHRVFFFLMFILIFGEYITTPLYTFVLYSGASFFHLFVSANFNFYIVKLIVGGNVNLHYFNDIDILLGELIFI